MIVITLNKMANIINRPLNQNIANTILVFKEHFMLWSVMNDY